MNSNVAFFIRHFTERGTEVSTYQYALYNQEILKNKSIIVAFNKINVKEGISFDNSSKTLFTDKFKVIEIQDISEMKEIILKEKISHVYIQSHGCHKDYYQLNSRHIWGNCITTYHYVFGPMLRQGSKVRCVIGEHLNQRFNKKIKVLPYIVEKLENHGDIRKELNIPKDGIVFGRHGGVSTFDIKFVHDSIKKVLKKKSNIYFIFLNTEKFYSHKNIIYLPKTFDRKVKSKFINSCDAMIHARRDGETFGLAVAEFSSLNKPIITFAKSIDKEHLNILGNKAIKYSNENELKDIFLNFENKYNLNKNWNCYKRFQPQKVIKEFEKICLKPKKKNLQESFIEIIYDLPWEIYIPIKSLYQLIFFSIIKSLPNPIKLIIKFLIKKIYP